MNTVTNLAASNPSELQRLLSQRRPGWSLEQPFYVDPAIYELDVERIYRRHWLLAAPGSRVGNVGDWFTYEVGTDSIVILRDECGAWKNAASLAAVAGKVVRLRCMMKDADLYSFQFTNPIKN